MLHTLNKRLISTIRLYRIHNGNYRCLHNTKTNSTIFKQYISDLRHVQSVINSISNVEVWANGATGLLNANSLNSLKTAVSGLSKEQALLVLSTKNLTQAQKEQVLIEAGIIASNDKINASIVQRALAESTLTAEQQKDILTKLELINVETGEVITKNACTKAALEEALAKKGIVGADAEAIISSIGLTSTNATQTISFDLLTASIWANIKALGKWLVTNPIGWAILGGTAIFGLAKAYDALTDSTEEVKERTDALLDSYNTAISEANSNAKTIESLASRYETLSKGVNNLGENVSLTADEYSEYNDIVNQIAEMFPAMITGYTDEGNAILSLKGNVEELRDAYKEAQKEAYNLLIVSGKDSDGNDIITNYQNQVHGDESFWSTTSSYIDGEAGAKDAIDVITRLTGALTPDEFRETYNQLYEEYKNIWNSDKIQDALKSSGFEELTHAPKWSELTTEDLANVKYSAQATVQTYQAEIDSQLQNVRTLANAYLMTNSDYEKLDEQSKTAVSLLVNSIDESIVDRFENKSDVGAYVAELISSISNNEDAKKALTELFTLDTTDMPVNDIQSNVNSYISTIATAIEEDPVELKARLGFDDTDTQPLIENVKKKLKGTEFDDKVEELNLGDLKIAADLEVGDDTIQSWDELIEKIKEAKLEELREQADQLSSIINEIQSSYDTLQSAIEEYNEQGYLSLDTLNSLLSLDDEYLACLVNENGQLSLNADAMNALAQSKLNEAEASAVAEAMTELYAIANGEAASSTANYISGNANLMQSLALLAGQYDNVANAAMTAAQAQELSAMIEKANTKDSAATARVMSGLNSRLGLIHSTASSIKTRNVGGISNKKSSGSGSASSVDTWKDEFQAQYDLLKHNLEMEYITEEQYYGALNALNEKYFANNAKYTDEYRKYQEEVYKGLQKVYKEYIENQMSYLEKALAANKISFSHYSSAVKTMLDDMWKEGKISAEDYWSYVEKMLKQQLDIYDSVINAVTNLLDKEIDKIQNEIDALEDKNDALNKQLDQYDGILAIVDDVYDAEIERIREQQDAIDDTIDKLQEENDEKQRGIELEKARYQLYKSLNQRNVKLFNGQEFVYTTNRDEVREAQQNLADLEFDQTIDALEKERDALDAEIEKLEEFKEKWADITEAYDNEINKQLAIALWGKDYESIILSNRISDIENFKDEYTSIQAQIDDNQSMIDSYNEKIEYYENLKEQWSDISKVYDEERDKLYASQILGAQWEKDILSGRLDLLNNFKEQYVLLQQQMAEAAVNSANAIIEANNRINSSTTSVPSSPFSGGSSGGGGTSTPAPAPVDPHPDKYWVYKTLGTYSTSGEASSKIGMLGGDQVIKVGSKYLVVKWKKGYTTQGEASSHISFLGGNGVYKRYAKGTINARKGLHLVSEDKYGDEIILRNNGTAVVAKGEQFYPFEGGETVINASDTKKLLANMDNLVPLHDSANPFARLKLQPIDSNAMVMNHLNLPNYNNLLPVNRDSSTTISIGDIHLHEVQNANTLANSIIRELPGKVIQRLGK